MATNYPGNLDNLTNPTAGDSMADVSHAAQHANANDAIEAIEAELGTDPSGAAATVKARIAAVESTADSAVQPGDLAAVATSGDYDDLSDKPTSMTPTAHKTSHATGGTDALSPSDIGAATAAQGSKADTAVQPGSLSTVATTGAYSDLTGKPTLGTAAAKDIPASGNASTNQVVYGTDTRLTDSRTPTAHKSTHAVGGTDALSVTDVAAMPGNWGAHDAGRYLITGSPSSVVAWANGIAVGLPFFVGATQTFDQIGVETTVAGSTGSVIRLGIFSIKGSTATRVLDAGTVDGTATAGLLTITISQSLTPGVYAIMAASQGSPTTNPTLRVSANVTTLGGMGLLSSATVMSGATSVAGLSFAATGAFASSYTINRSGSGGTIIHLRTA